MGGNIFQKITAGAKIALLGVVLLPNREMMNLVDEGALNAATFHEAIQSTTSQFNMVDQGDKISVRNSEGLEMLSLPANDETRDYYSDKIISREDYLARGGHFSKWRRAIVNGDQYFMETYDEETGATVKFTEIENIGEDLSNNHNLKMSELIDLVKVIAGDNIVDLPPYADGVLSYYDMKKETVISGTPVQVLSSALESAGFNEEQIDKLFEGTQYEDAEKKAERIARLEETDEELASDQFRDIKYYDAVREEGGYNLKKVSEMEPTEVTQMVIDRYATYVKEYLDADDKIAQFSDMLCAYTKNCSEEENEIKIAKVIAILDSAENGTIKNVRRNHDKRVDRMFGKNGVSHKKGNKYDQFTKTMEERIDEALETVDDVQTKFERLQNAEKEAMDYVNEGVARGSLKLEHYDTYVHKQIKAIEEACAGATEDAVYDAWEDLDRLEKTKRQMEDYKFIDFVIDECEYKERENARIETAKLNGEWYPGKDEVDRLEDKYHAIREIDDMIETPSEPKMVAMSIDSSDFYGGPEEVVGSDVLDDLLTPADAIIDQSGREEDIDLEEDNDFNLLNMDDIEL